MQALAKGQMSNAESPWLPGATEPILEASMETWQDGIQQQQEPHVFWAPALCLCVRPALRAQQSPMGLCSPMASLASAAQTSPPFHSPTSSASPASSTSTLWWSSLFPASQKWRGWQEICDTQFERCCYEDEQRTPSP